MPRAMDIGAKWMKNLRAVDSPKIREVRGCGLIIGIQMDTPETASEVQPYCHENRVLVNMAHCGTIRLVPSLIITDEQKDGFTKLLAECLE